MNIRLPGGLWEDGRRLRDAQFREPDGRLEMALLTAVETAASVPEAVSGVLGAALDKLAGRPADRTRAALLCVVDRRFLMRSLHAWLGGEAQWHTATCSRCKAPFDFPLRLSRLPVGEAGEGYPFARVSGGKTSWTLRLPNGADQEAIADLPDEETARQHLLARIRLDGPADALAEMAGDPDGWARIESALEAIAPALIDRVRADCPECGAQNVIEPDPYPLLRQSAHPLLEEIHRIARAYHWSETEILALPRGRRRRYLELIDAGRGLQA